MSKKVYKQSSAVEKSILRYLRPRSILFLPLVEAYLQEDAQSFEEKGKHVVLAMLFKVLQTKLIG